MTQEKELIELAAKALYQDCEINWQDDVCFVAIPCVVGEFTTYEIIEFNPHTSTSDRCLLMDELEIGIMWDNEDNEVTAQYIDQTCERESIRFRKKYNGTLEDKTRAANLAVTRVAAEIGRMKCSPSNSE